ncbi:MAG: hypothetical protein ACR2IF_18770 [Terriglobales bacterium]
MDAAILTARGDRLAQTRSGQLFARSAAVVRHHQDNSNPDKPLWIMIPSGAVAVIALVSIVWQGYDAWESRAEEALHQGMITLAVLLVLYFTALFIFSLGYELYDWPRAIRLTLLVGGLGLAAVFVLLVMGAVLRQVSIGWEWSRSKKSDSDDSDGSVGDLLDNVASAFSTFGVGTTIPDSPDDARMRTRAEATALMAAAIASAPKVCPFCAQPFHKPGANPSRVATNPHAVCPKCFRAYPASEQVATRAACSKCGVFGPLRASGMCPGCELRITAGSEPAIEVSPGPQPA